MRIAYDHQIFALQRHGGISRYFAELIQNLQREAAVDASVIAPVYINEYLQRPDVRERVHGQYLPLKFRGNARLVGALNSVLLPIGWRNRSFDVIHETYYSPVRRGRARVRVLTIYDMIHELFPAEFPDSASISAAKRAAVARADHVICISETTRRDAIELLSIPAEKCSVTYLGWSLDASSSTALARRRPFVLYVGNRNTYKNFGVMVQAFATSSVLRQQFDLIAFGGRAFSLEERKDLQRAGIEQQAYHLQGNDAVLKAHYAAAAAFVYPSKYEGFGIPPLEAMACDCPVICSSAGSISEVVGDAGAYFEPDDAATLASLIEKVGNDKAFADTLRSKGRERLKRYSWAQCAVDTMRIYRELAG